MSPSCLRTWHSVWAMGPPDFAARRSSGRDISVTVEFLAVEQIHIGPVVVAVRLSDLPTRWSHVTTVVLQGINSRATVSIWGWILHPSRRPELRPKLGLPARPTTPNTMRASENSKATPTPIRFRT